MRYGNFYIPDSIADEVLAGVADQYSGRERLGGIKTGGGEEPPASKTPPVVVQSNPAIPIMWIGAATSLGGFAIETSRYMSERKGK